MTTTDLKSTVAVAREKGLTPAAPAEQTIAGFINSMRGEIARALPRHMDADRMARIALTTVRRTPALERCTPASFAGALMTCAQLGLEPGATGEAYLIPYGTECTLVIGYKGMVKLFWQHPLARSIDAQVVYENDHFEYEYGLNPRLVHRPTLVDRGRPIAYYACASTTQGGSAFVVMSPQDIEVIRKRSKAKDNGPWKTDYDEMAKKTCLRRLFKLMPQSPEMGQALVHDGAVRTDTSLDAIDALPALPSTEDAPPAGVNSTTGEMPAEAPAPDDSETVDAEVIPPAGAGSAPWDEVPA